MSTTELWVAAEVGLCCVLGWEEIPGGEALAADICVAKTMLCLGIETQRGL